MTMFALIAILTVLQTGNHSTFKVISPFDNEQLCLAPASELVKYVVLLLPERGLDAEDSQAGRQGPRIRWLGKQPKISASASDSAFGW